MRVRDGRQHAPLGEHARLQIEPIPIEPADGLDGHLAPEEHVVPLADRAHRARSDDRADGVLLIEDVPRQERGRLLLGVGRRLGGHRQRGGEGDRPVVKRDPLRRLDGLARERADGGPDRVGKLAARTAKEALDRLVRTHLHTPDRPRTECAEGTAPVKVARPPAVRDVGLATMPRFIQRIG
ncbi:MAG: hypothetical protein QM820_05885 [Minicystis sp.]